MFGRFFFLLALLTTAAAAYQITNSEKPVCKTCVHFRPAPFMPPGDAIRHGTCRYYGKKDLLDGRVTHEFATIARRYNDCGENGTRYEPVRPLRDLFKIFFPQKK